MENWQRHEINGIGKLLEKGHNIPKSILHRQNFWVNSRKVANYEISKYNELAKDIPNAPLINSGQPVHLFLAKIAETMESGIISEEDYNKLKQFTTA